ncbi:MAG: DUF177 domain-containing protein [Bacteroidia bacterium]|nr:DUF177 domain-containing protein [Bacteroidia bacterium]
MGTKSKTYLIEFNKLKFGHNEFSFLLDDKFLADFEYSPYDKANIKVDLKLIKAETLYDLKFEFKGNVSVVCDTCAEDIDLPIEEKFGLLIKLSEVNNFDDSEIIYIARAEIEFDLKQYLYESLLLAVPQRKGCEELPEPKPCNVEVLKKLSHDEKFEDTETSSEDHENEDPRWNKLKDLLN